MIQCRRPSRDLYGEVLNVLGKILMEEERVLIEDKPCKWFRNTHMTISFNFVVVIDSQLN